MKFIDVLVSGELAAFTNPISKPEAMTYEIPTPSALAGVMQRAHPEKDVDWTAVGFYVLNPIRKSSLLVKEHTAIRSSASKKPAQDIRQIEVLVDVAYLVRYTAKSRVVDGVDQNGDFEKALYKAKRKIAEGQFDRQPCLGMSELFASLAERPTSFKPIVNFRVYRMFHSFGKFKNGHGCDPVYYMPEVDESGYVTCNAG